MKKISNLEYIKQRIKRRTSVDISDEVASEIEMLVFNETGHYRKQVTLVEHKQPHTLTHAASIYIDPEILEWKERTKLKYNAGPIYIDALTPHYRAVMNSLTALQRKIMIEVLLSYTKGITAKEIAVRSFKSNNIVGSILHRLELYGFVIKKDKRWSVPDIDFLRITAWRWDSRFRKFQETYTGSPDLIIDEYILAKLREC